MNTNQMALDALDKLARLGNGDCIGNSTGNTIAAQAAAEIRAALEAVQVEPVADILNHEEALLFARFHPESNLARCYIALYATQVKPGEWPTCKACGGNLWKCMACHPATSQEAAPTAAINQELAIKNMREIIRRHDVAAIWARHKAANTCVVCGGSGDIGTEQDHDPCTACNSTGKYQEPAAPKEVT